MSALLVDMVFVVEMLIFKDLLGVGLSAFLVDILIEVVWCGGDVTA